MVVWSHIYRKDIFNSVKNENNLLNDREESNLANKQCMEIGSLWSQASLVKYINYLMKIT